MEEEITSYLEKGYRIACRGDRWAQLWRPKSFSGVWFLLLTILTIGWGGLFYVVYYMSKRDLAVYVGFNADGLVYSVEYES